ncbi:MAG: N-acetylglucosamine-6-phosphate deacetylase [bacterium]|nr:N-acetylglucosamine-6-phosphate deacetylase [bacterium]
MSRLIISGVKLAADESGEAWDVGLGDGSVDSVAPGGSLVGGEMRYGSGLTLYPGFIDVHNHGAVGVDVNETGVDGLVAVAEFLASEGVTAWLPTLVPDSDENYLRVIGVIDRLMEMQSGQPIAQAVGVHYEGVFANEKMCGALRPEFFKTFTGREVIELPRLKHGVHMTTFAPEVENGVELARELTRQGWIASIGHTKADVETLDRACSAGARHVTHFFNAMTGIHHRDVGVAGWALTNPDVTFDIIADGTHVDPRMVELACRTKTPEKTILISDSVAPTGLGDGSYELWGETVVVENKRTRNERGSIAGSVISMLDAVNGVRSIGFSSGEIAKMASANPAKLLGVADLRGSIEVGKRADLVAVNDDGTVEFVMIGGSLVKLK